MRKAAFSALLAFAGLTLGAAGQAPRAAATFGLEYRFSTPSR